MSSISRSTSSWRIFSTSSAISILGLLAVVIFMGVGALGIALILVAVEIAFSFDNAIINARILSTLSRFWQRMFLTIGAVIAVFGMRILFPILIVSITAHLGWQKVLNLALHHPSLYAEKLSIAHPSIAAFGGSFLMLLALDFFTDENHQVLWLTKLERNMHKLARHWAPPFITMISIVVVTLLPWNQYKHDTVVAGLLGILVYTLLHGLTEVLGRMQSKEGTATAYTGMAAFLTFVYLEILDASFSFDGVIGAFAVTNKVLLIAAGLGIGALWVRSLTVFMVRRGTLSNYRYIEHGAHYTIAVLSCLLFVSIMYDVPEVITGLTGVGIIGSSIVASRQSIRAGKSKHTHA